MNFKEEMKNKNYIFSYIYDGNKNRVGTVVFVEGIFGFSYCNPSDNFNKAKGRYVAYQRAIHHIYKKRPEWLNKLPCPMEEGWEDYLFGLMLSLIERNSQ